MSTLFSYFNKKSSKPNNAAKKKKTEDANKSASESDMTVVDDEKVAIKEEVEEENESNIEPEETSKGGQLREGEIIWAKLSGYPWWPSMVCEHPKSKKFKSKDENNEDKIHVQFFGEPPSRDWVLERKVQSFKERKPTSEEDVRYAYDAAKRAEKLDIKKRIDVYYACKLSDEEIDASDEEDIKIKKSNKRLRGSSSKKSTKRIRLLDDSDGENDALEASDNDSNYDPGEKADDDFIDDDDYESGKSESDASMESSEEEKTPAKKKKSNTISKNITEKKNPTTPQSANKLNSSISRAQASLAKFSPAPTAALAPVGGAEERDFVHFTLPFMKDGKRKDKAGKLHTDPECDPRTLLVPQSYIDSKDCTPGMKQWWTIKRDLYDTVIFFKVGKFYELYHMDAVVGVKELGLIYMKGSFAHCGFPEIAFSRYSEVLIQRGLKVARIEQTETPEDLKAKGGGKVVKREVCAVISKGTRTFSFMESDSDASSNYLLAFAEQPSNQICLGGSEFGVCFVDTSIGKFHLGQFHDDRQSSRFLTMISQYPPAQVLFERNKVSQKVEHILTHELLPTIKEALSGSEFWGGAKTLKHLHENNYFNDENKNGPVEWPGCLKAMLCDGDTLSLEPSEKYQLAFSALGACIWQMKKCCIHIELLSMSKFEEYIPTDNVVEKRITSVLPQYMILDGVTLTNLDIVMNNEGTTQGTLLDLLDYCTTSFGKRYFKQWLCMPSCNKNAIQSRLDAVEDLMKLDAVTNDIKISMKTLPDLERLLRRIHSLGSLRRSTDHPDSRAIFYNDEAYSKKKIADLLGAIEGFQKSESVIGLLQENISSLSSPMLKSLLHKDSEKNEKGQFPDLLPTLKFFKDAFNHKVAKETGVIRPKPGVLAEYDEAMADIKNIEEELDDYLRRQKKRLGCSIRQNIK